MDLVSRDSRSEDISEKRILMLKDGWEGYEKTTKTDDDNNEPVDEKILEQLEDIKTVRSSFLTQLEVLSLRNIRQVYRNKFTLSVRLFMALFFSLFLSAVYSNTNYGQKSIQDRVGILFFVSINQSFSGMIGVVNAFTVEKAI
ncbi:ATP-binding cassette transporter, subfamily G, member 2, group WBC protein PpAB, partial [Reticulomyxa filosa]